MIVLPLGTMITSKIEEQQRTNESRERRSLADRHEACLLDFENLNNVSTPVRHRGVSGERL